MRQGIVRPFVGRSRELGILSAALDGAAHGRPSTVLVAADAGVGKTSLLKHWLALPGSRGAWQMSGACFDSADEGLPYGPIRDALRSFVRALDQRQIGAMLDVVGGGLSVLLPELIRDSDPELTSGHFPRQQRLFESVLDLMGWAGRIRPLVAVFEDLHWADPSSLACLSFLNSSLRSEPVLIVATYRTDELSRRHRLLGWIGEQLRKEPVRRLEVAPFDRSETEAMIAGVLQREPSPELADRIYRQSEGNAFYVEELVEASAAGPQVPSSLREVLLARIRGLSDETQAVMRIAAVGGRVIVPELLTAVVGQIGGSPERALREAFEANVVAPTADASTFAFRHALIHEVLLSEVLPGERERIHVAYAESLQERDDTQTADELPAIAQIAHHWFSAHDTTRALSFAVKAGLTAIGVGAFDDANAQLERAVSLWDATEQPESAAAMTRSQLLGQASRAAHLAGNDERAVALVNAAIKDADVSGDDTEKGLLYEMLGWFEFSRGPRQESFPAYERALELIPADPPSVERARVLAGYARLHMLWSMNDKAAALAEEALAAARSIGALREEAHALNPLGVALGDRGEIEAGLSCLLRSVELAHRVGDFEEEARAYTNLGELIFRSGDLGGAISTWLEGYEHAYRTGLRKHSGSFLLCNVCQAMFERGDWDGMEKTLREAERWLTPGFTENAWLTFSGRLAVGRGRLDLGSEYLRKAQAIDGGSPESLREMYLGLLELAVWEERYDDARRLTEGALSELTKSDEWHWAGLVLMLGLRAEADRALLLHGADAEEARRAGNALVELARAGEGDPLSTHLFSAQAAAAATCKAELDRLEGRSDAATWAKVADAWVACERRYHEAYARWREAEAHAANRQKRAAQEAIVRAHDIARSLGARPLLHEVRMLARRARLDLSPPAVPEVEKVPEEYSDEGRLGLTDREVEVLRQVAVGKTNKEIGETLFISPKTASVHVTHILTKLGVSSRVAAAAVAHKVGLLDRNQI